MFEGLYQASNLGNLRSLDRYFTQRNRWGNTHESFIKGRVLKPCTDKDGYFALHLKGRNHKNFYYSVHRLVALSFLSDSYFENAVVNHKDHDKTNNRLENLEWVTPSYNSKHSFENGNRERHFGSNNPASKLSEEQVREIKKLIPTMMQKDIAQRYGVSASLIYCIKVGKAWAFV